MTIDTGLAIILGCIWITVLFIIYLIEINIQNFYKYKNRNSYIKVIQAETDIACVKLLDKIYKKDPDKISQGVVNVVTRNLQHPIELNKPLDTGVKCSDFSRRLALKKSKDTQAMGQYENNTTFSGLKVEVNNCAQKTTPVHITEKDIANAKKRAHRNNN